MRVQGPSFTHVLNYKCMMIWVKVVHKKDYIFHYLYKVTCLVTNKFYVGIHSTNSLDDGYFGSGKHLKRSISKHGKENHTIEIMGFYKDRSSLVEAEKILITEDFLSNPLTMNLKLGGEGGRGWSRKEQQDNNRKSMDRQRWLKENDSDWVEKKSKNMSESLKLAYAEGRKESKTPNWKGRKHSEETKKKLSKISSERNSGQNNPSYGTMWIYNKETFECKKINKLDSIPDGWCRGRKIKK